ncbi:PREDICTED: actin-related protein 6 isoform X2 [Ceratosolen solmsi marchali]|uniref:Actin-related protein 6 n=1 Tax=Ceratosolen solmsi marchali TaxID=326594 RepID=A0AAJ6YF24_9HYME|nr:PREDICTED: actin-related protein 6 isoform X2 [Ceratosolen solmsi marchali]
MEVGLQKLDYQLILQLPNSIMKAKSERRRPFIGNQIEECRDVSGLYFMLPLQKGYLINWDVQKTVWDYIFSKECCPINLSHTSLIITEPPFNFPSVQEAMAEIFFEEYEISSLLRINPSTLSCYNYRHKNPTSKCCIIVDIGYSFSHIIPFVNDMKIKAGIRRIDVGGKLLTNHLKEILSYRQLHVMDETYVVNQVKEDSCFVSQNFYNDMETAKLKIEDNTIVKDYVLPDFTTIRRGYLTDAGTTLDQQVLRMNNERFSIPEILFHPSDVGIRQMGIPEAIMDCLKACEEETWPHLLSNIVLIGGSSKFPGLQNRVLNEVRSLAPIDYTIKVHLPEDPITYSWEGGKLLSKDPGYSNLIVKREEYEEEGHALCYDKFDI